jgi:outer membrane lipoprotein SlyB
MKHKYIILAALAAFSLVSCNDREVFEKEQYKNIFGFVSDLTTLRR